MLPSFPVLVDALFTLYFWIIVVRVVMSWLIGFNIVNPYNQVVRTVQSFVYRATEPLLAPIRRFMPDLGGLDISPIVLLLGLELVRTLIWKIMIGDV